MCQFQGFLTDLPSLWLVCVLWVVRVSAREGVCSFFHGDSLQWTANLGSEPEVLGEIWEANLLQSCSVGDYLTATHQRAASQAPATVSESFGCFLCIYLWWLWVVDYLNALSFLVTQCYNTGRIYAGHYCPLCLPLTTTISHIKLC